MIFIKILPFPRCTTPLRPKLILLQTTRIILSRDTSRVIKEIVFEYKTKIPGISLFRLLCLH